MRTPTLAAVLLALAAAPADPAAAALQPPIPWDPAARMASRPPPHAPAASADRGRPATDFDAEHYDLALEVDPSNRTIDGVATLTVRCVAPTSTLSIDLVALEARAVTVDGVARDFVQDSHQLHVDHPFEAGTSYDVAITYGGTPELAHDYLGFHFEPGIAYTFTEPDGSKWWFPCFDDPADKATLSLAITAPGHRRVAANGALVGETLLDDGRRRTVWQHDYPIAPYLVAVSIAEYTLLEDEVDGLPLMYWAYPDDADDAAADFALHTALVPLFEELFALPYPFEKYGVAMAPMGGAMEHQTCTTFGEDLVDGQGTYGLVLAHELAHHWWGDYVTCATWDDIWLNEGFATYSEALVVEAFYDTTSYTEYVRYLAETYLYWLQWEGMFPLSEPAYMWGGTVYDKGGVVVHMLRMEMGDEALVDGLADYAAAHAYGAATTDDLHDALQPHTTADLGQFFEQWVHTAGHPVFGVGMRVTELDDGAVQVDVGVEQLQPWPGLWEVTLPVSIGGELVELAIDEQRELFSLCRDAPPGGLVVDPDYRVLKEQVSLDITDWEYVDACGGGGDDDDSAGDDDDDLAGDDDVTLVPGDDCSCRLAGGTHPGALLPALLAALGWARVRGRRR